MLKIKTLIVDLTEPEGFSFIKRAFRLPMFLSSYFHCDSCPSSYRLLVQTNLSKVKSYDCLTLEDSLKLLECQIDSGKILHAVIYADSLAVCAWQAFGNKDKVCFELAYTQLDDSGNFVSLPADYVRYLCARFKKGL